MNKYTVLRHTLLAAVATCGLAACDGGEVGGNLSSDNNNQSSSASGNKPLADLTFADTSLTECVMATGKTMSDEVTELTCEKTISDLTGMGQLHKLESFEPQSLAMQVADFSEAPQLKNLLIRGSNSSVAMQLLDITNIPNLEILQLDDLEFASVDLSGNSQLKQLYIYGGDLETLDLSQQKNLEKLHISSAKDITEIDLSALSELQFLRFTLGILKAVDVSSNPKLEYLYLYANQLVELDLSNNPALLDIDVNSNEIESITWGEYTELAKINLKDNLLSDLETSTFPNVIHLNITDNPISTLDVTHNLSLKRLEAQGTNLSYVDLSNITNLETLYVNYSDIDCESAKRIKMELHDPSLISLANFGLNCTE